VFRGFSQQKGEDYDETLTPVIKEIVPVFMKNNHDSDTSMRCRGRNPYI
jgi:hypothetical protein